VPPPRQSPTVRRRRLGTELRRLREAVSLTIEHVATKLRWSPSKISRIETGNVRATLQDIEDVLDIYEAEGRSLGLPEVYGEGPSRQQLMSLAKLARQEGWWHPEYADVPITPLVGLEDAASSIFTYQQVLVPGLLQTDEYAHAVLREILMDDFEAERRVRFRRDRQKLLLQDNSPSFTAVLDEAVLCRPVGGRQVMTGQLERLVELASRANITIQVLPFEAGEHPGMDSSFTIIRFRDPIDPDVVYLEYAADSEYLQNSKVVDWYNHLFDRVKRKALNPERSRAQLVELGQLIERGWEWTYHARRRE
jgi:transcriptional regulator with XRE-family HTH domain